jgi:GNAT superfamily N-acetyltransferase
MAEPRLAPESPFVTPALSHRLESAEWLPSFSVVDRLSLEQPTLGAQRLEVAGGWAFFIGASSPLSHALGMGLYGPVSSADIDLVESLYRGRQPYCEIVVSPYADRSLVALLGERGYAITEWNSVLVHTLAELPELDSSEIQLQRIGSRDARLWAEVVAASFSDVAQVPPELFAPIAEAKEALCFLAYIDGQPVGGGGGSLFPEYGIASIFGASTLKAFRNRGVQTALLRARLREAKLAGCEYAIICTEPGTVSQHNAERNGFRVAYTKCAMQRRF